MIRNFLLFFFLLTISFKAHSIPNDDKLQTLYNRLNPHSVSQHLAFYELYGDRPIGKQALKTAWELMSGTPYSPNINFTGSISSSTIDALISLVNKPTDQGLPILNDEALQSIENLSKRLHHHSLKGHYAHAEEDVIALNFHDVDLARGLFLSQFGSELIKVRSYEAMIDLMALQILAQLKPNPTDEEKIEAINRFIFDEMGFRFPPHSLYAKDVDLYTFLPSVLDSRRGVCLGVSILYLCIAQRLALPLEMITPPGHIYIRYRTPNKEINIETTARGVHYHSEKYLGVNTRSLEQRNIKEVIGLAHTNQAAAFWQKQKYEDALKCYEKAKPYIENDYLVKEFMGYIYLITGRTEQGEKLLREIKDFVPDYAVIKDNIAEDYFNGNIDAKGIEIIFQSVDENRESILAKKEKLEQVLQKYPKFRSGLLQLAIAWLQLHRMGEASDTLQRYNTIFSGDPEVNYYLSILHAQRKDYPKAWTHLLQTEKILQTRQYDAKPIKELRRALTTCCPEDN